MLRGHLDNIDAASTVEGTSKMRGARICCADDALVGLEHWKSSNTRTWCFPISDRVVNRYDDAQEGLVWNIPVFDSAICVLLTFEISQARHFITMYLPFSRCTLRIELQERGVHSPSYRRTLRH